MSKTADLDVSSRPGKWTKRGVQPAVDGASNVPLIALNKLAERIREETDPKKKKRLEAEYTAQAKGIEDLTSDSTSLKLR